MSNIEWDSLTHIEECFLVNASEIDILPGVYGDLTPAERELPINDLVATLLSLIDRGLVEVCRYERWISPQGENGLTPGESLSQEELLIALADPASWEYPDDQNWVGALTLVRPPSRT